MADTEVDDLPENATPAMRRAARIALSLSDAQLNALPESQRAVLLRFRAMQAQRTSEARRARAARVHHVCHRCALARSAARSSPSARSRVTTLVHLDASTTRTPSRATLCSQRTRSIK